jgi:hypothetical protein
MNRRSILSLSAITVLGLAVLPGSAVSQQKSLKEQLVGTWTLVSTDTVRQDGTRFQQFGANPKGMLVFDGNGRYSQIFVRSDLHKFAATTADRGTTEENKAVMQGMVAHFGTYSVNEADKTITSKAEGSWFPNQVGTEAKRIVIALTADELRYTNPATALGTTAQTVWKRVK